MIQALMMVVNNDDNDDDGDDDDVDNDEMISRHLKKKLFDLFDFLMCNS